MIIKQYIKDFEKLGFGMFVHFGLYSIVGKGEWSKCTMEISDEYYFEELPKIFDPKKDWAKELVATAKQAGCKYITLTTRHHDGFSLFDTCGLNTFDAPHLVHPAIFPIFQTILNLSLLQTLSTYHVHMSKNQQMQNKIICSPSNLLYAVLILHQMSNLNQLI